MGTRDELVALMELMVAQQIRPVIDSVYGFPQAREAFDRLAHGDVFGKIVIDHTA
jgi:D-arabinose 1-dehydrogenase-like Zn-dependent alcohol dehydrogenase